MRNSSNKRKKIIIISLFTFILLVASILILKNNHLNTTQEIPFTNLKDFSSGGCFIYFNIEYKGTVYPIAYQNSMMQRPISMKSKFLWFIYPIYLNEVIKYDLNISVDDSLFTEFKYYIVQKEFIEKFKNAHLLGDTNYIKNDRIRAHLDQDEQNAIIYTLLKRGVNCCQDDISGFIDIIPSEINVEK